MAIKMMFKKYSPLTKSFVFIFMVLQIVSAAFQREYFTGKYAYGREGACKWDDEEHCYQFLNESDCVLHGLCAW